MIDTFAILTTTLAILYVLARAAALDRMLPWFEIEETASAPSNASDNESRLAPPANSKIF